MKENQNKSIKIVLLLFNATYVFRNKRKQRTFAPPNGEIPNVCVFALFDVAPNDPDGPLVWNAEEYQNKMKLSHAQQNIEE